MVGKIKKIFILADQDALLCFTIAADGNVRSICQAGFEDVLTVLAARL